MHWLLWSLQIFSSQLSYSGANNLTNTISFETPFQLFNFPTDLRNALIFLFLSHDIIELSCWWFLKYLLFSQIFHLGYNAIFITFLHSEWYKLLWFLDLSSEIYDIKLEVRKSIGSNKINLPMTVTIGKICAAHEGTCKVYSLGEYSSLHI